MSRRVAAGLAAGAITGLLAIMIWTLQVVAPPGAGAQPRVESGWVIEDFDTRIDLAPDGRLTVTETLTVDFGWLRRHGIFRDVPVRFEVPPEPWYGLPDGAAPDDLLRAIDISDVSVSSPTAPDQVHLERPGPLGGTHVRIRIGDPERTVSGQHRYTLRYVVEGAMDAPEGRPELFWDATGDEWAVPIRRATATVTGAGEVADTRCFRGRFGSTELCRATGTTFSARNLQPGEGMSVGVVYEAGSVQVPEPMLTYPWSPRRALLGSDAAVPLAVVSLLVGLGGVGLLAYRQGRDRVTAGSLSVDRRVREPAAHARPRRLLEPRTVAVRFRPPEDLRPAQLGLLVDESVDPVDISATVVDLAARGYLTIEEVDESLLWFSRTDWRLRRLSAPGRPDAAGEEEDATEGDAAAASAGEGLMHYERMLLDGLFADGDEVLLSDLKGEFATTYGKVQRAVYDDGQQRRWFAGRPDETRSRWLWIGIGALVVAVGLLVAAVVYTTIALAAVPLVLAALVLVGASGWMPHRTPRGSRLLDRALGFREFISTAEADRMDFAERERLFVSYLPYAVLFGATEHWARVFADLGVDLGGATGFWVGTGGFHPARFSGAMADFSGTVGTALSTAPSTGGSGFSTGGLSGGFSGGGFGGGGGGSW